MKTFDEKSEIDYVVDIFTYYNRLSENALVTMEGNAWTLLVYDENDKVICTLYVWSSGIFGPSGKQYSVAYEDKAKLQSLFNS